MKKYIVAGIVLLTSFVCIVLFVLSSGHVEICDAVQKILEMEKISECRLVKLGKYEKNSIRLDIPEVTDEDIDEYLQTVLGISKIENLTDEYVQEVYGFNSVEEYLKKIKKDILSDKKVTLIVENRNNILDYIIRNSTFKIDEDELLSFSSGIVSDYEATAEMLGMEFEIYVSKIMGMSNDEFYDFCYAKGERQIQEYLIVGAIYQKEFDGLWEKTDKGVYFDYQEICNKVFSLFISAEDGF